VIYRISAKLSYWNSVASRDNLSAHKKDIPLEVGLNVAKEFIDLTKDFYARIEIGGSIRRKEPIVHDIDLCAIAKDRESIPSYGKIVEKAGGKMIRFGGEYATLLFKGVQINVLFVAEETWGAGIMWSTGPKGHTIGMNIKADELGYKFNRKGISNRSTGELIPTPTEQDIATLLHWEYKPPELRGKNASREEPL
jgi:DNA polymerase (family X)